MNTQTDMSLGSVQNFSRNSPGIQHIFDEPNSILSFHPKGTEPISNENYVHFWAISRKILKRD